MSKNAFWVVARLPQRLKSTLFEKFFKRSGPEGASGVKKKFQKMLILAFEVIMQPPKRHFLTFSKVKKAHNGEKSETKIMKNS